MEMKLRLAALSDICGIMEIIKEIVPLMNASGNLQWNAGYPNTVAFKKDVANSHLWIAEYDGKMAGVAAITDILTPEYAQAGLDINESIIVIHRLAVAPAFRGLRVAESLLAKSEKIAAERGVKQVWIDTNRENRAARNLFMKMGYFYAGDIIYATKPGLVFSCYYRRN